MTRLLASLEWLTGGILALLLGWYFGTLLLLGDAPLDCVAAILLSLVFACVAWSLLPVPNMSPKLGRPTRQPKPVLTEAEKKEKANRRYVRQKPWSRRRSMERAGYGGMV